MMKKSLLMVAISVSILLVQCRALTPISSYKTTYELEAEKKSLQADLEEINAGIATLDAAIAHHTKTKQAMHNALAEAKAQGKQPDVSRLVALATATGYRSEQYDKSPKMIRDLLDQYETRLDNYVQGLTTAPALKTIYGPNYGHYMQEIARSYEFIQLLEKEKAKLITNKAEAEARIAEIDKELAETRARWKAKQEKGSGNGNGGY